ncbi:lysozyme [Bartonella sp. CDC_skunk]|uniref:lysozyme n=1 Tax=Bartonella sp. CDC_skunk TaxID=1933905 RepID=UPI00099A6760|nr:lysozyme [Bartonella sp. CDC_skunk]AQX21091.1 lysozyme [Bartonella sp. CDC_skunk]
MRKISPEGLALIKQWEGLRLNAYKDAIGVWTIGYGHTNAAGEPFVYEGMTITEKKAEKLLCRDLRQFEDAVERAVIVSLTNEQFAALVSFCYNVGTAAFCNSTLLKKLNKGEYEAVPSELQKWTKAGGKRLNGLVHRRAAEAGLWAKGAYVSSNYQTVEAQEPTKILKAEVLAPIIASVSGLAELLEGNGPVQYALATIIVFASCLGLVFVANCDRNLIPFLVVFY